MVYAVYKIYFLFLKRICDAIFDFNGLVNCSTLSVLSDWSPIGQIKPYQIGPFWDSSNCASASFPLTTWLLWALVFQHFQFWEFIMVHSKGRHVTCEGLLGNYFNKDGGISVLEAKQESALLDFHNEVQLWSDSFHRKHVFTLGIPVLYSITAWI